MRFELVGLIALFGSVGSHLTTVCTSTAPSTCNPATLVFFFGTYHNLSPGDSAPGTVYIEDPDGVITSGGFSDICNANADASGTCPIPDLKANCGVAAALATAHSPALAPSALATAHPAALAAALTAATALTAPALTAARSAFLASLRAASRLGTAHRCARRCGGRRRRHRCARMEARDPASAHHPGQVSTLLLSSYLVAAARSEVRSEHLPQPWLLPLRISTCTCVVVCARMQCGTCAFTRPHVAGTPWRRRHPSSALLSAPAPRICTWSAQCASEIPSTSPPPPPHWPRRSRRRKRRGWRPRRWRRPRPRERPRDALRRSGPDSRPRRRRRPRRRCARCMCGHLGRWVARWLH